VMFTTKEDNELQNKSKKRDYFFTRIYYPVSHGVTKRKYKSRYVRFVPSNAMIVLVNHGWVDAESTAPKYFPSFRHYIVIPDQILPNAWIDRQND
jgi:hypothetical protein